jgi:hypothetical protein
MKKHFSLIFLLVASISWGQSNLERENRFKKFLNSIPELKNGYVFTECKENPSSNLYNSCFSNLTGMSGIDYVLLNAVSIKDSRNEFDTKDRLFLSYIIENRLFLGYIKEPTGTIVVITAATRYDSIQYLYSPELMLYSNTGEKLAQINLTRTECLAGYPNFTIEKNSFIRKYSCVDTIVDGYNDDGQEFIGKKAFPHEDNFKISFDNSGFIITNLNGLIVKGKNLYNGNRYDLYSGEIVYPNRSVYTGQFELDSYGFSASPQGIGEFKNSSGKIVKGKFCGDTTLCVYPKYPKIFLGKFLLGDSAEITKDELLNSRKFSTSVGKILFFECTFKVGESFKVFSSLGSTFKNNADFTNNLKQITLGSKIFFEFKYRDNIGKIHFLVHTVRVK